MNPINDNPYATPQAALIDHSSDAEATRREHISHEASIKAIGLLYYLNGGFILVGGLGLLMAGLLGSNVGASQGLGSAVMLGIGIFFLGLTALTFFLGRGLRTLRRGVRIPVAIFSGLGLLAFPLGTVINGYILYLVLSKKGRTILSDEYADVVAQTPDIRYKTSILVWLVLGLLVALMAAAVLIPMMKRMG